MNRLERALVALDGLTMGDAFGDQLPNQAERKEAALTNRTLPSGTWHWTDDSNMAFSIVAVLRQYGEINQEALALSFARHYDVERGYGPSTHRKIRRLQEEKIHWREMIEQEEKSWGNGGAMRVAPLGPYFADAMDRVVQQAALSAEVTHAHPEGIAGTIAVAVAAAYAWRLRGQPFPTRTAFLDLILAHVPDSEVREKIHQARNLAAEATITLAAAELGDGRYITAQDTVAFTLWCAGNTLDNYEEGLWWTVSKSGDRDTNCAIVGGIVASYLGSKAIPAVWKLHREPYPAWFVDEEAQITGER